MQISPQSLCEESGISFVFKKLIFWNSRKEYRFQTWWIECTGHGFLKEVSMIHYLLRDVFAFKEQQNKVKLPLVCFLFHSQYRKSENQTLITMTKDGNVFHTKGCISNVMRTLVLWNFVTCISFYYSYYLTCSLLSSYPVVSDVRLKAQVEM